jgi:hypothetical protein
MLNVVALAPKPGIDKLVGLRTEGSVWTLMSQALNCAKPATFTWILTEEPTAIAATLEGLR